MEAEGFGVGLVRFFFIFGVYLIFIFLSSYGVCGWVFDFREEGLKLFNETFILYFFFGWNIRFLLNVFWFGSLWV